VVSATESRGQDDGAYDIRLRSYDTRTGHLAWQLSAPPGLVYGLPKIADGRLYVVRQPKSDDVDASTRTDLLVLDAKSGQLLHTLPLPRPPAADRPYDDEVMVNSVTGGAVNMSRRYRELMIATG
jgi:outer membrane protein assembly factor BamB